MKSFFVALMMLLMYSNLYSQSQNDCLKRIRSGKIFTNEIELKEWLNICKNDTISLLNCLVVHISDSVLVDKLPASISLIKNISIKSTNEKIKGASIKFFLSASKSKNSGISSLSLNTLKKYPSMFFDSSDLDSISSLIEKYPNVYKESVEIAGYLGDTRFLSKIHEVFPSSRSFSKPERWATYKALARLGDKEALDYCISRISSLKLSDQVVDALYPDLIYIHRKEAFDVLIKALNSDENLCTSSNPNSDRKIVCGYRIMELLAPEIENFPVKILPSGDLDAKDYKKALLEVRAWFNTNGNNYTILNNF